MKVGKSSDLHENSWQIHIKKYSSLLNTTLNKIIFRDSHMKELD